MRGAGRLVPERAFVRDDRGVWCEQAPSDVSYADGAEALLDRYFGGEERALESPPGELHWPLLYHLSPARHALLSTLAISGRVLELGAGMGALTGALLDRADAVLAVEGAYPRARVLRRRFAGEPRLDVLCADIGALPFAGAFDVVTMVGVLEYAGAFGAGRERPAAEAAAALLASAARYLRPGGRLVLAIENAFGTKYWTGCQEDHYGAPFVGIEGYDGAGRGIRTYARDELSRMVVGAGFEVRAIHGCWPDYKFPTWLVDLSAAPGDAAPVVAGLPPTPCPDHQPTRLIRERALLGALSRTELLAYLWNSFLVEAVRA